MQLVERHFIHRGHAAFVEIDKAGFASKNLYNRALYDVRQHFFKTGKGISQSKLDKLAKSWPEYRVLPAKVSQMVLMQVADGWKDYFAARCAYQKDPSRFLGRPGIPGYKDKNGRNVLTYNRQAINARTALAQGIVQPSGLPEITKTLQAAKRVLMVRIVPKYSAYVVEVVYAADPQPAELDPELFAGVDMGVDNLATVTFNRPGLVPFAVSGRELKSIHPFFNQRRAELQSLLPNGRHTSRRLERMQSKRYRRVQDIFHKASHFIVNQLIQLQVGTLVIGKNDGWKQNVNIGKRNNQTFVSIPHARFIDLLSYKAELAGIRVVAQEEAYTSKCSFLDLEPICHNDPYTGRRIHRGLFQSANGTWVNADCNGSYNIIRKFNPHVFPNVAVKQTKGIAGYVVHPFRVNVPSLNSNKLNQAFGLICP